LGSNLLYEAYNPLDALGHPVENLLDHPTTRRTRRRVMRLVMYGAATSRRKRQVVPRIYGACTFLIESWDEYWQIGG